MKGSFFSAVVLVCVSYFPCTAAAQGKVGDEMQDFPPGAFSDGHKYRLADFKGKVAVLYFFDGTWTETKAYYVPDANDVASRYKNKPIKFLAVGAGMTSSAAIAYARATGLTMPVFADNLGLMQKRYGQMVAGKKTVRFVVIGADGAILENEWILLSIDATKIATKPKAVVEKVVDEQKAEWKYNHKDYDPKLEPALQDFEWNHYEAGMKLLAPLRKSKNKKLAESANLLFAEIKKEGEAWKEEAEKSAGEKPVQAYDLYLHVARVFTGDALAKEVAAPLKKLKANKTVTKELAARTEMVKLEAQMAQMSPAQRPQALALCKSLAKRFAGTPTAEQAQAMALELGN